MIGRKSVTLQNKLQNKKMRKQLLTFFCLLCLGSASATGIYNVRDYGAKGDGTTLDSPAINAAIEAAAKDGGGQVLYLPARISAAASD